jgi:RNA polymerase sigma-70 factor (ECF subfamily)
MKYQSLSNELFDLFKEGNVDALKHVYDLYFNDLYGYIKSIVPDEAVANDIAVDCILRLRDYRLSVKDATHLRAYLFRTAMTRCVDYHRRLKVTRNLEMEYLQSLAEDEQYLEEEKLKGELLSAIEQHVKSLPQRSQDVLRLLYLEGLEREEVASRLKISVNTVYMINHRAIKGLRKLIPPPDALGILLLVYFLLHTDNQTIGVPFEKEKIFFQK